MRCEEDGRVGDDRRPDDVAWLRIRYARRTHCHEASKTNIQPLGASPANSGSYTQAVEYVIRCRLSSVRRENDLTPKFRGDHVTDTP